MVDVRGSPRQTHRVGRYPGPAADGRAPQHRQSLHATQPYIVLVRHALEPAFERLGPNARPEEMLDLKVCDPAMGSGSFLVEACRVSARVIAIVLLAAKIEPLFGNHCTGYEARIAAKRCSTQWTIMSRIISPEMPAVVATQPSSRNCIQQSGVALQVPPDNNRAQSRRDRDSQRNASLVQF